MIYADWMSYIKDGVRFTGVVMPSAHNAGSYGMPKMACCQDDDLKVQFEYGIRHYCLRLDTDKKTGKIVICHGITKGCPLEGELLKLRQAMDEHPTEFFIIDIREYYPQKFGPVTLKYKADPKEVDRILENTLEPSKYAFTDFENIGDVTFSDLRNSGKRYIIINYREDYKYSVNCPHIFPWDKKTYGNRAFEFATKVTDAYDSQDTKGFYWLQTQQTPNLGTDVGVVTPRTLDRRLRWHFKTIINTIANNPKYLEKANIIAGDFMTEDLFKVREILMLNINKNNVIEDKRNEFIAGLKACK